LHVRSSLPGRRQRRHPLSGRTIATRTDRFAFAYTITVQNNGEKPARLMSRHWVITDGDGHVEEVRGAGVVGQQPLIEAAKATPTAAAR
jgi:uncharacterized protein affecting Mg2+/Co2+ transport